MYFIHHTEKNISTKKKVDKGSSCNRVSTFHKLKLTGSSLYSNLAAHAAGDNLVFFRMKQLRVSQSRPPSPSSQDYSLTFHQTSLKLDW